MKRRMAKTIAITGITIIAALGWTPAAANATAASPGEGTHAATLLSSGQWVVVQRMSSYEDCSAVWYVVQSQYLAMTCMYEPGNFLPWTLYGVLP
jgi:hypothetical protein